MAVFRYRTVQKRTFGLACIAVALAVLTFFVLRDKGLPYLDGVNLLFHEAGHMLLLLAPEFLTVLAGTALQLIIPTVCMLHFLGREEPVGALAMFWWLGENLIDVAAYIGDARAQVLPLFGGGGHDWHYLLSTFGLLPYDTAIASVVYFIGAAMMFGSIGGILRHAYLTHVRAFSTATPVQPTQ